MEGPRLENDRRSSQALVPAANSSPMADRRPQGNTVSVTSSIRANARLEISARGVILEANADAKGFGLNNLLGVLKFWK